MGSFSHIMRRDASSRILSNSPPFSLASVLFFLLLLSFPNSLSLSQTDTVFLNFPGYVAFTHCGPQWRLVSPRSGEKEWVQSNTKDGVKESDRAKKE